MGKWNWTTQCQGSCPLLRQGPTNGMNEQMESHTFFKKKPTMWHYFGYRIGCGSISPECLPSAIFLVLTPYNVQLLWSFLCTKKLIQRLLHSMNTPQFSHNMPVSWFCLVMHSSHGSIRKLKKKHHCDKHDFQCSTSILWRKKNLGPAFQY